MFKATLEHPADKSDKTDTTDVAGPKWRPTRKLAVAVAVGSAGVLALNHYKAVESGEVYLVGVFLAPLVLMLGLGGLVDPRVLWAIGKYRHLVPPWPRRAGAVLVAAGLAMSAFLAFWYLG